MNTDDKINAIFKNVNDIKIEIAKALVHQEAHKELLKTHEGKITTLEAYRNKTIGVASVVGLFFGAIGAGIVSLIKHI